VRSRAWWPEALAGLLAAFGLAALLARRSRPTPAPATTYTEGWQGIGGPSYAPRPTTVRVEPRTTKPDTTRINGGPEAARRPENLRRPFGVPDDFDAPGFLDSARQSFVRLQSAWDRSDLHELNECTTDEMFNALTHELRVRAGPSRTEVIELTASLLGIETAAGEFRASVRFSGNLKVNGEDERLDEVWNLSKPEDGTSGWLLAGIQQLN
jgi:predicted lipid-binding transport protein (Tim44 family)